MNIPEDLKLIYHDAKTFESSPSISNSSLVALIERIATLTEQLEEANQKFESMRRINDANLESYNTCARQCDALTEQLHKCAAAARSYEAAVAMGEPFGDEVKAVLTLRQNADAGFAELARARAEIEQLGKVLEEVTKQRDDNEDYLAEMYMAGTGLEAEWSNLFGPEEAIENVKAERDTLRAQLEQMARPVTHEEWRQYVPQGSRARIAIDALLAARARQ